jgi:prolyl-tRNA synthetase
VKNLLRVIQDNLLQRSHDFREANTHEVESLEQLKAMFAEEGGAGYASCLHCGSLECDKQIKDLLGVTNRCFPFDEITRTGQCIVCGSPGRRAILGRAY